METATGDEELDVFAEAFKRSSKKRKAAQDAELDARSVLIDAMKRKKLTHYEDRRVDPPLLVMLVSKDKVKVTAIDEAAEVEDDDEEAEADGAKYAEMAEQKASRKKPVLSEA
jgi:hypothetical protein